MIFPEISQNFSITVNKLNKCSKCARNYGCIHKVELVIATIDEFETMQLCNFKQHE